MRRPDFLIIGAPKCGTTTLYEVLRRHPRVFFPVYKEPHFFAQMEVHPDRRHLLRPVHDPDDYSALFHPAQPGQLLGDASTSSMYAPGADERIHRANPDARILIMLRDPIKRAFSAYHMVQRNRGGLPPFVDLIRQELEGTHPDMEIWRQYIPRGRFAPDVQRFMDTFGRDQVKVLLLDDLHRDFDATVADVCAFLDIDADKIARDGLQERHNPFRVPRGGAAARLLHSRAFRRIAQAIVPYRVRGRIIEMLMRPAPKPELPIEAQRLLTPYYADDVQRLEELLSRRLPELRASFVT